jgi:hypothetical protein
MVATSRPPRHRRPRLPDHIACLFGLHKSERIGYGGAGWFTVRCTICGAEDIGC